MKRLMIYGATGYTGRMVAELAAASGLSPLLAGRDASKLAALADSLQVEHRVFALDSLDSIAYALADVSVILNCAGPFQRTARRLMEAAIRCGAHYLDVSAELDSYRLAEALDDQAIQAGSMLLPGSGGSVAMLGCLAGHAIGLVPTPVRLRLALQVRGAMSRGSVISATENLSAQCLMRVDGQLVGRAPNELQPFDFGRGLVDCIPVTLPDLVTVWRSTGVPWIETFVHMGGSNFPQGDLSALADGPSAEERAANRYRAIAEVTDGDGNVRHALLDTVNGYTFTSMAAVEAARRVLEGETRPGFQTPAGLFGKGFATSIADTRIIRIC